VLLWVVGGGGFHDKWDLGFPKLLPPLRTFTYEAERTLDPPTEPLGHKPLVVNVVVEGPLKEEEEGTGIASDVVKVQGEEPDGAGHPRLSQGVQGEVGTSAISDRGCVLGSLTMKPRDHT